MRFGLKIFLMTFTLVIISTTALGIILINNSYQTNMETAINKNITEIININSTVNSNVSELVYLADNYLSNNMYTKVYHESDVIFTNFKSSDSIEETLINSLDDNIKSYIKDGTLYMAYKESYTIITKTDISNITEEKDEEISYFIRISIFISLIIAFILSILVNFMTKKIKRLNEEIKKIAEGNYDIKVTSKSNDEIGEFASSISTMAQAIDTNIKKIENISEQRKIFIGNLTHEIRTPLTSIIGYSSLIKNNKVTDLKIIKNYSSKIYEEGKYIEEIRDKLTNILDLNNKKIKLEKTNISIELESHINELKDLYPATSFILDIKEKIYKELDKTLFRSLIYNLVKNGIEASNNPIIKITLNEEVLIIEDNGKGIKKEDINKIKEPFYTANKDRNRDTSGMGLGLTLCCNIIDIHKWTLDIKSTPNKGTKMLINFGGLS